MKLVDVDVVVPKLQAMAEASMKSALGSNSDDAGGKVARKAMKAIAGTLHAVIKILNDHVMTAKVPQVMMLDEPNPKVLTLDDVRRFVYGTPYIIETNLPSDEPRLMYGLYSHNGIAGNFDFATVNERISLLKSDYGRRWRCWTSAPNDEQRRSEPWQNQS